jgi:lipopolysaccharide export LptBFGC system permease protein LptF
MSILDRFIMIEFFQVLAIGTLAILGVFFGAVEFQGALNLLGTFEVPLHTLIMVMLLQIPTGALYTLPAGLLFSTMFVLIRLNRDFELTALRTLGISLQRIMLSFAMIGVLSATISYAIGEHIAPQAKLLSTKLLMVAVNKTERPYPKKNKFEVVDEKGVPKQIVIMGNNLDSTINGFLVLDMRQSHTVTLVWSRLAEWKDSGWKLTDGKLFELLGDHPAGHKGSFGSMQIPGLAECWRNINAAATSNLEKTTAELKAEIDSYAAKKQPCPNSLLISYHRRLSQPLSCMLIIFAAAPVALLQRRRSAIVSYIYGGLILPLYFILQQICLSAGSAGMLDPVIAAWLPASGLAALGLCTAMFVRR